MPYDQNGEYTSVVLRDAQGFVNEVAQQQPVPGPQGPMTSTKAAAIIAKEIG